MYPGRATGPRSHHDDLLAYAESVGVTVLSTVIARALAGHLQPSNLLMFYLLGIVAVATRRGRGPSVLAALLAVVTFDFFFVPPVRTFRTSDLEYFFTFGVMLAVALVICTRSERLRREAVAVHEYELRMETERLRSSLLSSISHDLRTPLAAITGAAESLLRRDDRFDAETQRALKETIHEEAKRLSRLVENLLSMTRLESGVRLKKDLQPLEEVIGTALGRLEPSLVGRTLTTRVSRSLPLVAIDEVLIEQVLINLLENALKYTPAGSPLEVRAFADHGRVTVEVADRGPGVRSGEEERIFEKFYRGRTDGVPGAGLGLAICRSVIQAHGGRIWAERRPGGGAVFRFTLPSEPVAEPARAGAS